MKARTAASARAILGRVASRGTAVRLDRELNDDSNQRLGRHSEPSARAAMNTMG
jgi:hypothetical protein